MRVLEKPQVIYWQYKNFRTTVTGTIW